MTQAVAPDLSALRAYAAAWSASDLASAEQLLRQGCADGCDIVGPGYHLAGLPAVLQEMRRFHREMPGWSAVATSGFDAHGSWVRFAIAVHDPEGRPVREGWDIVELDAQARVVRVVTFWGPLPARSAAATAA